MASNPDLASCLVRPRVFCPEIGEVIPLIDHVESLLNRDIKGNINLYGPPGSGKTVALQQLRGAFPDDDRLKIMDGGRAPYVALRNHLMIFTTEDRKIGTSALEMAPWTKDEWIEYMLTRWRDRCKSVMTRVLNDDYAPALGGNPQLWSAVLDTLARGPDWLDIRGALRRRAGQLASSPQRHADGAALCLKQITHTAADEQLEAAFMATDQPYALLLRHAPVQVLLASDMLVYLLCDAADARSLGEQWPPQLIREAAHQLHQRDGAMQILESTLEAAEIRLHPVAASLLLEMCPRWRPSSRNIPCLAHAQLNKAQWQHVDLFGAHLESASLCNADLRSARLQRAKARKCRLRCADLRGSLLKSIEATSADLASADLSQAQADHADFTHANLAGAKLGGAHLRKSKFVGANLKGADFCQADLRKAHFRNAKLQGADFTSANLASAQFAEARLCDTTLSGACLVRAGLASCNLEDMELNAIDFTRANLIRSLLTGASLRRSILRKANLRQTGLADVDLEGADLRSADLRGASFHLGSSRSGLVGSVIPCEGSKTGFYTDERDEHHFRSPEEIRKANLKGADLRGAKIKGVDFYLVDLRGARFTRKQGKYFKRCGAILT